jgi:hypothetical protein
MTVPVSAQEHQAIQDLLGVYALDAVDRDTAERVERHLIGCVKCSIEVAQHHEVAGLLANSGGPSPPRLWDGIAGRLDATGPPSWERLAERLDADPTDRGPARTSEVVPITHAGRRHRAAVWIAGTIAGAAAVVAVVLGVQVHHLNQHVSVLQARPSLSSAEQSALADHSTRTVRLTSSTDAPVGRATVVLTASGTGFVEAAGLSSLPKDQTYQLWGVIGDRTISLGLMGPSPGVVSFTVAGNAPVSAFAITAERAGGVVQSAHQAVVAGRLTA